MSNWREAAEKYRQSMAKNTTELSPAAALEELMDSDQGHEAMLLLRASGRMVELCTVIDKRHPQIFERWHLDGRGFHHAKFNDGEMEFDHAVGPREVVDAYNRHSNLGTDPLVVRLRAGLDEIAAAAPGQGQHKSRQEER